MKSALASPIDVRSAHISRPVVKVWDSFVRFFHWSQLGLIVGLILSAHFGKQEIHQFLGFSLAVIVIARLIWGVTSPGHARFRNFVTSPQAALRYLVEVLRGHPRRYLGHNPAGGWMVLALLANLVVLLVTGFVLQATLEFSGPLVELFSGVDDRTVHDLLQVHEVTLNLLYLLVPLHLLGVVLASRQHQENLALAMITGHKPSTTER